MGKLDAGAGCRDAGHPESYRCWHLVRDRKRPFVADAYDLSVIVWMRSLQESQEERCYRDQDARPFVPEAARG